MGEELPLTDGQRRALLWLPEDGTPVAFPVPKVISGSISSLRRQRPDLVSVGMKRTRSMVALTDIALTPNGLALRQHANLCAYIPGPLPGGGS